VRDIEAKEPLYICFILSAGELVIISYNAYVLIRPESLDVKGQCTYFCICLIINLKYIVACRPTMIKEYGGLKSTG
jgi:hypothetical protein